MAQARHDSAVMVSNIYHSPFSRGEKVPEGRMRALSSTHDLSGSLRDILEDPHPALRATFPRRGKGEFSISACILFRLEIFHVH